MGLKRVMWVRRYQGQCRALRPLGHQGYRLRSYKKHQPLCSGYNLMQVHPLCSTVNVSMTRGDLVMPLTATTAVVVCCR